MATHSISPKEARKAILRKGIQGLMAIAFLGTLASSLIPAYTGSARRVATPTATATAEPSAAEILQQQAQGFERVLQREPTNPVALEGLAQTRLTLGDAAGAIAPLKTLTQRYPDRGDYQIWLTQAQQQVSNQPPR